LNEDQECWIAARFTKPESFPRVTGVSTRLLLMIGGESMQKSLAHVTALWATEQPRAGDTFA